MDEAFSTVRILAELQHSLNDWLLSRGFESDVSVLMTTLAGIIAMLVLALITDALARLVLGKLIPALVNRLFGAGRSAVWQAALRKHTLARRSAHIVAALVVYLMTPQVLSAYPSWVTFLRNLIEGYVVLVTLIAINAVLRATVDVLRQQEWSTGLPLQFLAQTAQAVVWLVGGVLIISVVFDRSVGVLLTGMAGMTALLMLVFRDTLLGWVAGIQIVNNDLVREGDWIDVPKYGADGAVSDIGLITVKVRNWDKTISSVPSYALISGGFKNWRGMEESGGRRIKRAVPIDMKGIGFCSAEMLERLRKIEILREYIDHKLEEIERFNREHDLDESEPANGRRLTNIGTYLAYLQRYLRHHPAIRHDMLLMVRQLAPGPEGLPIEIYAFSAKQNWTDYEAIQADIIDHALAVLPAFGLRVYQYPSSGELNVPDAGH
jgi:miniconductance mechanosensitive channel